MSKIYKKLCEQCERPYIGFGKNYCSKDCAWKSEKRAKAISEAKTGINTMTPEHKAFLLNFHTGRKTSEETKKKTSEALKGEKCYWHNKKHSEESRKKMSNSHAHGEKHKNWKGGLTADLALYKRLAKYKRRAREANTLGSFTPFEWRQLKEAYLFTCPCCLKKEPEIVLTVDHVIPISKGGMNYTWNIQPLCKSCNSKKSTKGTFFERRKIEGTETSVIFRGNAVTFDRIPLIV